MKVLVLFSLVALCFSTQLSTHSHITVGEDGTIALIGAKGTELYIYKSLVNPSKINIIFKNPFGLSRKIQVDDSLNIENVDFNLLDSRFFSNNIPRDQITQAQILEEIFRQFQGIVDEHTYGILLNNVQTLVNNGFLRAPFFEALRFFDQMHKVDNVVRPSLSQDVVYPVEEMQVSGVIPVEGEILGLNKYRNVLPIQGNFGIQGLWNLENLTPYQRAQLLLQLKQRQYQQTSPIEQELNKEFIRQQMVQQPFQQQGGQFEKTTLNRFLINAGVLKPQEILYPHQLVYPQIGKQFTYQQTVPQQWTQKQGFEQMVHQYPQYVNQQVYPQQWVHQQVEPQQWVHQQVGPQQLVHQQLYPQELVHQQVYPQQLTQQRFTPQQQIQSLIAPGRVIPQQIQGWFGQGRIVPQQQYGVAY